MLNDVTQSTLTHAMAELKQLHKDAIPAALEKAERYRLLNEPGEAESICLDILAVDPDNQRAIITLLLAFTDRFEKTYGVSETQTKELLSRVKSEMSGVLFRNHRRTPGKDETATAHAGLPVSGLRSFTRSNGLVRKSRTAQPIRSRRCDFAVEHLRPHH